MERGPDENVEERLEVACEIVLHVVGPLEEFHRHERRHTSAAFGPVRKPVVVAATGVSNERGRVPIVEDPNNTPVWELLYHKVTFADIAVEDPAELACKVEA